MMNWVEKTFLQGLKEVPRVGVGYEMPKQRRERHEAVERYINQMSNVDLLRLIERALDE